MSKNDDIAKVKSKKQGKHRSIAAIPNLSTPDKNHRVSTSIILFIHLDNVSELSFGYICDLCDEVVHSPQMCHHR